MSTKLTQQVSRNNSPRARQKSRMVKACPTLSGRLALFSYRRLALVAIAEPFIKPAPRLQSFPRPYPKSRGDSHDHGHQILDHEYGEVWRHGGEVVDWARDSESLTRLHVPGLLPLLSESLLVEVARDHDGSGNRVEHAKHADAHHQPLQLLRLGAVVLHDGSDAEKRHEAGQEERGADEEVDEEGCQDEATQRVHAVDANVAHPGENVTVHLAHGEDGDGLNCWDSPSGKVEILRVGLNGFMTPLHSRGEEPCEGQNDPPDWTCHAEEIEDHEEDSAALFFRALRDGLKTIIVEFVNANGFVFKEKASRVRNSHHEVTPREEDDGPLRVTEPPHVHQVRENGEQSTNAAQNRPNTNPEPAELDLFLSKIHQPVGSSGLTRRPAVLFPHEVVLEIRWHFELQRTRELLAGSDHVRL